MMSVSTQWLGRVDYEASLKIQEDFCIQVQECPQIVVIGCEHPATITLGKRGRLQDDVLAQQEDLVRLGAKVFMVERGGHATLHSPGQLVIYPIVPLRQMGIGVRQYLNILEEATIHCLGAFGLKVASRGPEPGLYSESGKVVFFGVRIKAGVSLHGLAINISNQLDLFSLIRSCGIQNESFDSLSHYTSNLSPVRVYQAWTEQFSHLVRRYFLRPNESISNVAGSLEA